MCARLAVVYVEYYNCDDDTQPDQQHGEEQILAEQGQRQRRRRYNFGYQQEEHGLRQEDANAQCNLLARVRRQVEDEHAQVGDADTGDDQVDGVEQGLSPQCDVEEDVCVGGCGAMTHEESRASGRKYE